jgi:hypothetical protein
MLHVWQRELHVEMMLTATFTGITFGHPNRRNIQ